MLVLPIGKTSNDQLLIEYLQDELPNIILPKDYVHLAGYDFGKLSIELKKFAQKSKSKCYAVLYCLNVTF